ncbi:hypothetical protein A5N83_00825 [Rhodococcus sp. 1139]|nr:hypothetical protein A5N83_00825 [Rhodococcus sp. 1139]
MSDGLRWIVSESCGVDETKNRVDVATFESTTDVIRMSSKLGCPKVKHTSLSTELRLIWVNPHEERVNIEILHPMLAARCIMQGSSLSERCH